MPKLRGVNMKKFDFFYKRSSLVWIEDNSLVKTLWLNASWSSSSSRQRFASDFYTSKVLFELASQTGSLTSLAVDWINSMLYYTYTDSPRSYIKVTRLLSGDGMLADSGHHYTLLTTTQDKPGLLVVNPKLRYLYWMDQGQQAKMERASLDGSNRTVIVSRELSTPTDLFVDARSGYLYWADNTLDRIETCDFAGNNRRVLKAQGLPSPQSLYVLGGDLLFFADARLKSVFSLNLTTTATNSSTTMIKRLDRATSSLSEVFVYSDKSQVVDNIETPCSTSGCDQLCFALPGVNVPRCACAIGELDAQNGRSCKTPKEYLIYAMGRCFFVSILNVLRVVNSQFLDGKNNSLEGEGGGVKGSNQKNNSSAVYF